MRSALLVTVILFTSYLSRSQYIDSVIFTGLTKTSEPYLRTLLYSEEGMFFNDSIRLEDEQTLNNLNLFFSVEGSYQFNESTKNYNVYFNIIESTYVYPIIDISGFKSVFKLQLGINNINFKGEQKTIGLWYQYYDRHSFSAYHRVPRYKNQPFGHDLIISKYSTVEPLYFEGLTSFFNFDNYSIWLNGIYWLKRNTNTQIGIAPIFEVYEQLDTVDLDLPAKNFTFWKYRINSSINFKAIDYLYERVDGIESSLYFESIQTHDMPEASFFLAKLTTAYHYFIKKKGNLSWRHQIGISSNNLSPFAPFVLDGFLNIRGIGNRVARGSGIHFVNLEYKHTIVKNKIVSIQGVAFADAGTIREVGESFTLLFDPRKTTAYAGLGIRLHSNKIYKSIFRLDYGVNLSSEFQGGFSFGIGQFF